MHDAQLNQRFRIHRFKSRPENPWGYPHKRSGYRWASGSSVWSGYPARIQALQLFFSVTIDSRCLDKPALTVVAARLWFILYGVSPREIKVDETLTLYTSSKWVWISRVDMLRTYNETMHSSKHPAVSRLFQEAVAQSYGHGNYQYFYWQYHILHNQGVFIPTSRARSTSFGNRLSRSCSPDRSFGDL